MVGQIPIPVNEKKRLGKLQYYQILDSETEKMFDDLTQLTSKIIGVPISLISLVDENRQWFKSKQGLDVSETPRNISFCQHAIMGSEIFEVQNAIEDSRFKENPLVLQDPSIRFYAGAPLLDSEGDAIGTLCAIDRVPRELDDKQREALKLLADTAMQMIKLRREKLEVEILARAKDEFLSNMSHEIRTPLNAIIGFNDLLRKTKVNAQQKAFLDTLHISSQNLKVIINDILDFSKLESGRIVLEKRPISISRLVGHVVKLQAHSAKEKGLKLFSSIDHEIPDFVLGDETRLIQILINLVGNAIKFTNEGHVDLRVFAQNLENSKTVITFLVRDTGIGIPKEKLSSIFERFSQAESNTTRLFGGTGLGLSIVEMLVNLQEGGISVESDFGKGSEFKVEIPYIISEQGNEGVASDELLEVNGALFKEAKILLVEDNAHNQFLAKTYFERWGGKIEISGNGQKALESIEKNRYDVILMDLQMPIMNGFTATHEIRNTMKLKIPIIGCSAHSLSGDREKCIEAGMNDYIAKPYSEEELIQTTLKWYRKTEKKAIKTPNNSNPPVTDNFQTVLQDKKEEYGEGIINELVALFCKNIPEKVESLKKGVEQGNCKIIEQEVHYLSGTLGSLGFDIGRELCQKTETIAESGNIEDAKKYAGDVITYMDKAVLQLELIKSSS